MLGDITTNEIGWAISRETESIPSLKVLLRVDPLFMYPDIATTARLVIINRSTKDTNMIQPTTATSTNTPSPSFLFPLFLTTQSLPTNTTTKIPIILPALPVHGLHILLKHPRRPSQRHAADHRRLQLREMDDRHVDARERIHVPRSDLLHVHVAELLHLLPILLRQVVHEVASVATGSPHAETVERIQHASLQRAEFHAENRPTRRFRAGIVRVHSI